MTKAETVLGPGLGRPLVVSRRGAMSIPGVARSPHHAHAPIRVTTTPQGPARASTRLLRVCRPLGGWHPPCGEKTLVPRGLPEAVASDPHHPRYPTAEGPMSVNRCGQPIVRTHTRSGLSRLGQGAKRGTGRAAANRAQQFTWSRPSFVGGSMKPRERRWTCRRGSFERRAWERRRVERRHLTVPTLPERRLAARRVRLAQRTATDRRSGRDRRSNPNARRGALDAALAALGACLDLVHQADTLDPELRAKLLEHLATVATVIHRAVRDVHPSSTRAVASPRE